MGRAPWDDAHDCLRHMVEDEAGGPDYCAFCGADYSWRMIVPEEFWHLGEETIRSIVLDCLGPRDRSGSAGHAA